MAEFLEFLSRQSFADLVRLLWFYFIFDFPRYILLDVYGIVIYIFERRFRRSAYHEARQRLWKEMPFVSIIVPGKDEAENYYSLVRTLKEQTYQNFELIIIDDGSEDHSELLGRQMERNGDIDLFLSTDTRGGKASAANLGFNYSKGKYVLHFDADSSFYRDAVERILIPFYMDGKIGAVAGNLEVRNKEESLATILQTIEYFFTITVARLVNAKLGILRIVSGAFGAFRRDLLEQVGGWDVGPGLDGDLTTKIRKLGYKIHFEPLATALTSVPTSFFSLAKQRVRWSRSLIRFRLRKHRDILMVSKASHFKNIISVLENLFFNLGVNIVFWIYLVDILINFNTYIVYILLLSFLLYSGSKFIEYLLYLAIGDDRRSKLKYLFFVPGMVLYTGYFIRTVRTIAYVVEIIWKESFADPWNPKKTSDASRQLEDYIASDTKIYDQYIKQRKGKKQEQPAESSE
mgnify:CR=1 FL=1